MKSLPTAAVSLSLSLWLTGCATLFKGDPNPIPMNTTPTGAEVWINGENRGTTPVSLQLQADQHYTIVFKKAGYKDKTYRITKKVPAKWVILDVLGGLIPIIVDAATKEWYELDTKVINEELVPLK